MPELDLGNVKGPQGKSAYQSALDAGYSGSEEAFNTAMAKAPDAVLYTAQSLTDEQKAQARTNIGAVDSALLNSIGTIIGLCGWNQIIPTKAYVNSVTDTKTYLDFTIQAYLGNDYIGVLFNQYQSTPGKIVGIFTSKYDCNRITWKHSGATADISLIANAFRTPAQIKTGDKLLVSLDVLSVNSTVTGGLSVDNQMLINLTELFGAGNEPSSVDEFRAIFGETYYPYYDYPTAITKNGIVEYLNPPMELGIEYRITERYKGKPVYVKAVNFGALPNAATKTVIWATADEVSAVLSVEATGSQGAPVGLGASLSGTEITATTTTLYIKSTGDYSSNTAVFRIKYTKTTD